MHPPPPQACNTFGAHQLPSFATGRSKILSQCYYLVLLRCIAEHEDCVAVYICLSRSLELALHSPMHADSQFLHLGGSEASNCPECSSAVSSRHLTTGVVLESCTFSTPFEGPGSRYIRAFAGSLPNPPPTLLFDVNTSCAIAFMNTHGVERACDCSMRLVGPPVFSYPTSLQQQHCASKENRNHPVPNMNGHQCANFKALGTIAILNCPVVRLWLICRGVSEGRGLLLWACNQPIPGRFCPGTIQRQPYYPGEVGIWERG